MVMMNPVSFLARRVRRRLSRTPVRVPVVWLRHWGIGSRDVFMAGYTRSGNAWLRFLLYEILTNQPAQFSLVNRHVSDVGGHHHSRALLPEGGRLIKTHEAYRNVYRKAIYIVRDPRDVMISEYAFYISDGRMSCNFEQFVSMFLKGKTNGYRPWSDNVRSWIDSPLAGDGNLHVVRFEELKRNPPQVLQEVLRFLEVEVSAERVHSAVANNTLERMQKKEDQEPQLAANALQGSRYIRSGAVQQWRGRFTQSQLAMVAKAFGDILIRVGYPSGPESASTG